MTVQRSPGHDGMGLETDPRNVLPATRAAVFCVVFADRLASHPGEPEVAIFFWTQAAERLTELLG